MKLELFFLGERVPQHPRGKRPSRELRKHTLTPGTEKHTDLQDDFSQQTGKRQIKVKPLIREAHTSPEKTPWGQMCPAKEAGGVLRGLLRVPCYLPFPLGAQETRPSQSSL